MSALPVHLEPYGPSRKKATVGFWLGLASSAAILQRIWLYLCYRPVLYSDTRSYRRLAEAIANGWKHYDGTRTPGYPIFLTLFGTDERVYVAQLALGLLITLALFYLGWRTSGKGWFGTLCGLAYTLNPQQFLFEANLITETLTTFLLTITLAILCWLLTHEQKPLGTTLLAAFGTGILGGLAALTRPLFIFVPFWAALFIFLGKSKRPPILRWGAALAGSLSGLAVLALWVGFIHQRFGRWSLTTMTGYHLVQHTGAFFEYVPDQYAALRDTYLRYRALRIAETGQPNNTIWEAIPAMQEASGLSFYDLSDLLTKISLQLIRQHPMLYLRSVAEGWLWFWKAPVYWSPESLSSCASCLPLLQVYIWIWRGVMLLANVLFLLGSVSMVRAKVRWGFQMNSFHWFLASAAWVTSILQTLLDHGDNPRFAVPIQTFIIILALWWGWKIIEKSSLVRSKS